MQETVPEGGICNTMIPPSPLAPDDSSCWEWYTPPADGVLPPDAPTPPTGCDYEPCQNAVCECDSYCCDTAWDLSCRGYYMKAGDDIENNYFVPGCSAKLLCCEQESAFPDPPIGAAMAGATNIVQVFPAFAEVETKYQCDPSKPISGKFCCETMKPPSFLPPGDSSCWDWWTPPTDGVMPAGAPPPPKGCDYQPCQDAVCACDAYCCETAWDESCRGYDLQPGDTVQNNYFVDGCSAEILCCNNDLTVPSKQLIKETIIEEIPVGGAVDISQQEVVISEEVIVKEEVVVKEVPVPVPQTVVKEIPVPVSQTVVKEIPVPVPVPQKQVIPVPKPVPVVQPKVVYNPVPIPPPVPQQEITVQIPVVSTTQTVTTEQKCACPPLPEISSVVISQTSKGKSGKAGKTKSKGKSGKTKSKSKSGSKGSKSKSSKSDSKSKSSKSKSSKSTSVATSSSYTTASTSVGTYELSPGCTCPCYCSVPQTVVVSSSNSSGKAGSQTKSKGKAGKAGRRRLSKSKSATTFTSTQTTYTNDSCICTNVASSTVIQTAGKAGTSKSKSRVIQTAGKAVKAGTSKSKSRVR